MYTKTEKKPEDLQINDYFRNLNLYLEQMHIIREFQNV